MKITHNIDTKLFYLNPTERTILPCTIKSFNMSEKGLVYTISVGEDIIETIEENLIDKISKDLDYNDEKQYYISPKPEYDTSDRARYKSNYSCFEIYQITSAEISVFRSHGEVSCIDFGCTLIGEVETRVLEKIGIRIPSVTKTDFFSIDDKDHAVLIKDFNDPLNRLRIMEFIKPVAKAATSNERNRYHNVLDSIILSVNPDIQSTFKPLDNESETSELVQKDGYGVNKHYVVVLKGVTPPTKIDYQEVGLVNVELEFIRSIERRDTAVLPEYDIHSIVEFNNVSKHVFSTFDENYIVHALKQVRHAVSSRGIDYALSELRNACENSENSELEPILNLITEVYNKTNMEWH